MSIRQFFALVHVQARMGLKAEAARLYLSYLWWVIEPMLYVLTFYFVFEVLLDLGRGQFILFLMCGKIPFLWFSKSVLGASDSIVNGKGLIDQVNAPKQMFPYVALQQILYKQWVVFLLLFAITVAYGYMPGWGWLWLGPLIVVQYLLILVCSLLAALAVAYVGDMRILIQMSMMFLMFSSGIFWDISRIGGPAMQQLVLIWNPLAFLLDAYRAILMRDELYNLVHLGALALVLVGLLALIHAFYHCRSRAIAVRVMTT